ncbi:histidine kinase [Chitinophagaceae bacterium MMS25-I14]
MRHLQLLVLLSVSIFLCYGCNEKKSKEKLTGLASVDPTILQLLDTAFAQKDPAKGLAMINPFYRQPLDSATHAVVCGGLARLHFTYGSTDSVIFYAKEALPYLEQHTGFILKLANCYYMIGLCMMQSSEPNLFLSNYYLTKAALICNSPGADTIFPFKFRIIVSGLASESNRDCQLYKPALQYGISAVSIGRQYQDSIPIEYIKSLTDYTKILIDKKQYDSALYYCNTASSFNQQKAHNEMAEDINAALGACYFAEKRFDSAASCNLRVLTLEERATEPDSISLFSAYSSMLGIYNELHRQKDAKKYLDKAEQLLAKKRSVADAATLKNFTLNKIAYSLLYGKSASTYTLFDDYIEQHKDFYNKEQLKMEEAVYAEYDLADKERKIQALNLQRLTTEADLRARTNLLTVAALATLLAILTIIILILLQRQRKLKNAQQLLGVEHNKIELEQRLLRTQMEPHFIFNALTNLLTLIDKGENKKASGYVVRFANLLRTSLENSKESYVLLSEELSALENYLELQKMRFNDLFDFAINVDKDVDADNILIPPMLIQPIAENAIVHGFKGIEYKGLIEISIRKSNGLLHCTVLDNGTGYRLIQNRNRQVSSSTITSERLAILSRQTGQPASLEIIAEPDRKGVRVELVVPFKEDV